VKEKVSQIIQKAELAVKNVLNTMVMVEAKTGKPYLKKENTSHGDISGIIGFSSPDGKNKGSMSITFTEQSAKGLVSNMLGENFEQINKDVIDAVGELTNMICGQFRKELVEIGLVFEGGIPSVVTGKNHSISHVSNSAILAIPFETPFGPMVVEICFA